MSCVFLGVRGLRLFEVKDCLILGMGMCIIGGFRFP